MTDTKIQLNQVLNNQPLLDIIHKRHSIRNFKLDFHVEKEEIMKMLKEATFAPSGGNLQSWRFLVIDSPEEKEKLFPIAFRQKQILEASAVIVVLGDLKCYERAETIYNQAVDEGVMSKDFARSSVQRYKSLYSSMSQEDILQTVSVECGLASMQFMLVAQAKGYATGPMRGFDKEKLIELFNISNRYTPVLLIALGKEAQPGNATVRIPIEEITWYNKMPQ